MKCYAQVNKSKSFMCIAVERLLSYSAEKKVVQQECTCTTKKWKYNMKWHIKQNKEEMQYV